MINVERYAHAWTALVAQLTSLEELDLYRIDLSNRQMRLLENLVHLKRLRIKPNGTGAGLKSLSRLGSLEHLFLVDGGEYSDAGLKHMGRLTALKTLTMTDAGLVHLKRLKDLQDLRLSGTRVTDEGIENLQKELPNLDP